MNTSKPINITIEQKVVLFPELSITEMLLKKKKKCCKKFKKSKRCKSCPMNC